MEKNYSIDLSNELELIVRYASRFDCPGAEGLNPIEKKNVFFKNYGIC